MKTAIITGATSGIGKAITKRLLEQGFFVFGLGRNIENQETKRNLAWIYLDVEDEQSIKEAFKNIYQKVETIDVLVNNAGIGCVAPIETIPMAMVQKVFEINFYGVIRVCQQVIPKMRKQKKGHIINITSIAGYAGLPFQGIYSASKFALEGFTEALSMELKQFGIKVVMIEPGDFSTNIYKNRQVYLSENCLYKEYVEKTSDLMTEAVKKGKNPDEIGKLVLKIIKKKKPQLRYITANTFQILSALAKRVFRGRFFEYLVMKVYKIPRKI